MKTEQDVIKALRKVKYVERTADLAKRFRRIPNEKPFKPRKDKVFGIFKKLGYESAFKDKRFSVSDKNGNNFLLMEVRDYWIWTAYIYKEFPKYVFWSMGAMQRLVADDNTYRSGCPVAHSYDDLEEILTTMVKIYEESNEILNSDDSLSDAPIPDTKNLICIRTKEEEVLEVLRNIKFLERSTKMCKAFCHSSRIALPKVEKDKIFEIVRSYGYEVGHEYSWFYLKNQFVGPYHFIMRFELKYFVADFTWWVREEGESVGGDVWLGLCRELAGDKPFGPPYKPSFRNLEEFKRLIAVAFNMFEDFKYALCKSKGIDYTRKDPLKIWKDLYSGELKNAPGPDEN